MAGIASEYPVPVGLIIQVMDSFLRLWLEFARNPYLADRGNLFRVTLRSCHQSRYLCSAGVCVFAAPLDCLRMVQEMAPACNEDLLKRALKTHGKDAIGFLILAKSILGAEAYKKLIKASQEIVKRR